MKIQAKLRLCVAVSLIALAAFCGAAALNVAHAGERTLGFEERVAYQRKIEEIYWRHRSTTQSAGQTLSFAEAMPEAAIRMKVEDTLRKSAALAHYWNRPVTAAQLQAEVARIAARTRQPKVLAELFAALDHRPDVIAECLARPILVERQLQSWYARDVRFHGERRAQIALELETNRSAPLESLSGTYSSHRYTRQDAVPGTKSEAVESINRTPLSDDEWQRLVSHLHRTYGTGNTSSDTDSGALEAGKSGASFPSAHLSALQESETDFYVVSVVDQSASELTVASSHWPKEPMDVWWQRVRSQHAAVDPVVASAEIHTLPQIAAPTAGEDDTWRPTTAPLTARENHTAIWTGTEMIVWGGYFNPSNYSNYEVTVGSRYNPATDSWHLTSITNAPAWRERHTAVWTGSEMLVWGGNSGTTGVTNTGARYNPATDLWTPITTTGAPLKRTEHTAIWTGSRMLVWGGRSGDTDSTVINTGGSYDPVSNSWTTISTSGAPAARQLHIAVWSGTEMIVWGGVPANGNGLNTGGRYNPASDSWRATTTTGALPGRLLPNAFWTGSKMLVWGGSAGFFTGTYYNTGSLYDPVADTWTGITNTGAPAGRNDAAAVWTGTEMVVWGGFGSSGRLRSGGRYNLESNSWQSVSMVGAPQNSISMSTVWTGTEMLIWGGQEPSGADLNTGSRYRPSDNTWVPITNPQNGGARNEHPAVWTGRRDDRLGELHLTEDSDEQRGALLSFD